MLAVWARCSGSNGVCGVWVSLLEEAWYCTHTVGYEDQGKLRPVIYRESLVEMTVPYGDTSTSVTQSRKNAFDCGEYG